MATTFNASTDNAFAGTQAAAPKSTSVLSRIYAAMIASRERAAEREIERYIQLNGGTLTDHLERDISRNFGRIAG